jgi:TetR/AcrR family transcriptional repressor of nem operon
MHAIWSDGYEQASVKALSELLGISRSSFYNAFVSREAMFAEIVKRYAALSPDAPLQHAVTGPILPLLTTVFRSICRVRGADREARGCMIVNAVVDLCPSKDQPGRMLQHLVLGSARRIESLLETAKTRGELPTSADPHALALAVQTLMIGLNVICKVVRDEEQLWLLTQTTLNGLGLLAEGRHA